jgi:hypothetical protein
VFAFVFSPPLHLDILYFSARETGGDVFYVCARTWYVGLTCSPEKFGKPGGERLWLCSSQKFLPFLVRDHAQLSLQSERITVVHESVFVDIAETMLVGFLVAVLKIARMLQGQAKFDVVFVVMQYCMVGPGATCTLLQLLQFWHLQV